MITSPFDFEKDYEDGMEEEPLLAEHDQGGHQRHLVGEGIVVVVGVKEKEV